ncbi:MAG: elongation factor G [Planctomycetota bacterium]|jgi:elongation factor G|nr:elongation factor G [Planctomycetota bacterium]MDP7247998.1 elongation factor G [Planctomycetota bacterium]
MDDPDLSKLRNFGIVAHIDAGKTTLTERILFCTGRRHRIGNVDDGDTVTDSDQEERERGITITAAAVTSNWKKHKLNLIDTPGHVDFTAEVERSLRVLDGAVVVFCGVAGVQAQSETVWRIADGYHVPRIAFINKMDRVGADFQKAVKSIEDRLSITPVPIQIPIGAGRELEGVIDLIRMKKLRFDWDQEPPLCEESDIPAGLLDEAEEARALMIERAAECDEELLELFVNDDPVPEEMIRAVLRKGTLSREICPVLCGTALGNVGVEPVLDAIVELLPSPLEVPPAVGHHPKDQNKEIECKPDPGGPLAGLIFKTHTDHHGTLAFFRIYSGTLKARASVYNPGRKKAERANKLWRIFADKREEVTEVSAGDIVGIVGLRTSVTGDTLCDNKKQVLLERITFPQTIISLSVEPQSSADQPDLEEALEQMALDDPTLEIKMDDETGQTILSGMGELHLEIIKHRLLRERKLNVRVGQPRVRYRESITQPATGIGTFDREIGERRHKATVEVQVTPLNSLDFEVNTTLDRKEIPLPLIEAMRESVQVCGGSGPTEGYPLLRLKAVITGVPDFDHTLTTDIAVSSAAAAAFEKAVEAAAPVMLEPIMHLELAVPNENVGDILFDLGGRRAEVQETDFLDDFQRISAFCPLSELFGYATQFRSLTSGRGDLTVEPSDYRPRK